MNEYSFNIVRGGLYMNLSKQLSITAKNNPTKTAYIFQDEKTSYLQLEGAVTKLASQLEALGYKKGDHIALVVGNSPYYVIGLYAALKLGVVVIPINPMYTAHEMKYILLNGDVKAVITMDIFMDKFVDLDEQLPSVEHYISCETGAGLYVDRHLLTTKLQSFTYIVREGDLEIDPPSLEQEDTAIILYTSGTTDKPKGAMLTHKNLYSNAKDTADYLHINGDDRFIAAL